MRLIGKPWLAASIAVLALLCGGCEDATQLWADANHPTLDFQGLAGSAKQAANGKMCLVVNYAYEDELQQLFVPLGDDGRPVWPYAAAQSDRLDVIYKAETDTQKQQLLTGAALPIAIEPASITPAGEPSTTQPNILNETETLHNREQAMFGYWLPPDRRYVQPVPFDSFRPYHCVPSWETVAIVPPTLPRKPGDVARARFKAALATPFVAAYDAGRDVVEAPVAIFLFFAWRE